MTPLGEAVLSLLDTLTPEPPARITRHEELRPTVHRVALERPEGVRCFVLKRLEPRRALLNELVITRWLPAAGLEGYTQELAGHRAEADGSFVWHAYPDPGGHVLGPADLGEPVVERALERIVRVHTRFAGHPLLGEIRHHGFDVGAGSFPRHVRDALRALEALDARRLPTGTRHVVRRLTARLRALDAEAEGRAEVAERLSGPETLIHGDLSTNVIVPQTGMPGDVRLIDWDHAGVGTVPYDLSTFLDRFPEEVRDDLLGTYRRMIESTGWRIPSEPDLRVLFQTAELTRLANIAVWRALELLERYDGWSAAQLTELDAWFDARGVVTPRAHTRSTARTRVHELPTVVVGTRQWCRKPEFAGHMWVALQYVLGLERLGVRVVWVDQLYDHDFRETVHGFDYCLRRFEAVTHEFGLDGQWCILMDGDRHFGLGERALAEFISDAHALVNLGGHLPTGSPLGTIGSRAFVDLDPGFTQVWGLTDDLGFTRHNRFFTVGQNVGKEGFAVPTLGVPWEPILPFFVPDHWPPRISEACSRFSTVADWRGAQEALHEGTYYDGKRSQFIRFLRTPRESGRPIELALCIGLDDHEDLALLHGNEWIVSNAYLHAGHPLAYREFIQRSRGEFSVAKGGYVHSNSGWISDRTVCYLASGKPALVQSTGFEWRLPVGRGLLTFRTVDEAVSRLHEIDRDYLGHCHAAREFALRYFSSDVVLRHMLERMGIPAAVTGGTAATGG